MTDFAASWELSRGRFVDSYQGLNQEQIHWRIHDQALTIAEAVLHVAGVEVSFSSQLTGQAITPFGEKLKLAATEGVVNDNPFPFASEDVTTVTLQEAMDYAKTLSEPLITNPSEEVLKKELKSALGPMISGYGALARFAFHPAYHQGQVYLIRMAPGFPA